MRSSNKTYTITEYGGFTRNVSFSGYQSLPEKTFDALETFILANTYGMETKAVELLSLSARRGIGKIITARNYVGLITMTDGTVIEILPKIAGGDISDGDTKRIFLEMLKTLKDVTFKDFNVSNLHTDRLSLLEIFIKMFLEEVFILTKQGLKAAYTLVEANERFYKGKLMASQNIKHNLMNYERFFVRYDDFSINRPENRLIKSTLRFLLKQTADSRNRQNTTRLLTFFEGVDYSASYEADFSKCISDRSMSHYDKALSWCRVFLRGNSFTAFAGSEIALALLFPMEKVFESFVAAKFRRHIGGGINLRTQDARYSLFDSPTRAFALRPDLVLEFDGKTIVMDTKWKMLSDNARNSGISQSDMYQMYAYSKKYGADCIVLLYPHSDNVSRSEFRYASDDNVNVEVSFIDLRNSDSSIVNLIAKVC
ncbi:MAG: McrC family protein [Christensenellales bacterium]|jgi:5-methylcytosine-specific restriction enzyme subunit McrC